MGYNGMGYQRWIATMKPREFLGKRSKPDGGGMKSEFSTDIVSFYKLKKRSLTNLGTKKYSARYKEKLRNELQNENRKNTGLYLLSVIVGIGLLILLVAYINSVIQLW